MDQTHLWDSKQSQLFARLPGTEFHRLLQTEQSKFGQMFDIQHSTFKFWMSNIEYQTKPNIQIECRISNIKLNPTFKSNVEYRISNSISHSNFKCRISNIKLNPTFKSNVEYRISNSISHSYFECRISNIKLNPTFKSNVEYRISN